MTTRASVLIVSPYCFLPTMVAHLRVNEIYSCLSELPDLDVQRVDLQPSVCRVGWWPWSFRMPRFLTGDRLGRNGNAIERFLQRTIHWALRAVGKDEWWLWAVSTYLVVARSRRRFDYVLASSPPYSAYELALRLARGMGAELISDFRDLPISYYKSAIGRTKLRGMLCRTSAFLATTDFQASRVLELCPDVLSLCTGGFIAGSYESRKTKARSIDLITVVYGGSLYVGQRDLSSLFGAVAEAAGKLRLVLFLNDQDRLIANRWVNEYGVSKLVEVRGLVGRGEFFNYCRDSADCGLVVIGKNEGDVDHENAVPAKFYEYLRGGVPVLALAPHGSAIARMMERASFGAHVAEDCGPSELLHAAQFAAGVRITSDAASLFDSRKLLAPLMQYLCGGSSRRTPREITLR